MFSVPHWPAMVPRCPTAVIADKIKHKHFQNESKLPFLPPLSTLPLCSQSAQPFQPLATRAKAWQAISGVSAWVMNTVKQGYSFQFARRPPRFRGVLATSVHSDDARVLCAEVMNMLEIVPPAQSQSGFYRQLQGLILSPVIFHYKVCIYHFRQYI